MYPMTLRLEYPLVGSGSQTGSQRRQTRRDTGRRPGTIGAGKWPVRRLPATVSDGSVTPEKRKVDSSILSLTTTWEASRQPSHLRKRAKERESIPDHHPPRAPGRRGGLPAPVPTSFQPHLAGPGRPGRRADGAERLVLPADAAPLWRQRPQRPGPSYIRPHHARPAVTSRAGTACAEVSTTAAHGRSEASLCHQWVPWLLA